MGKIFINYRRKLNQSEAELLAEFLKRSLGKRRVFIDVSGLDGGQQWLQTLERQVDASSVMVAVIGPGWAAAADEQGKRRLDDLNDFVRFEIARAFSRPIPVLPVLLDGAEVPHASELPPNLLQLTYTQAMQFRASSREADAGRIALRLRHLVAQSGGRGVSRRLAATLAVAGLLLGAIIGPAALSVAGFDDARVQRADAERRAALAAQASAEAEAKAAIDNAKAAEVAKAAAESKAASEVQAKRKAEAEAARSQTDLATTTRELVALRAKLADAVAARTQAEKDVATSNAEVERLRRQGSLPSFVGSEPSRSSTQASVPADRLPAAPPSMSVGNPRADGTWAGTYDCAGEWGLSLQIVVQNGNGITFINGSSRTRWVELRISESKALFARDAVGKTATLSGGYLGDSISAAGNETNGDKLCQVKLSKVSRK